MLLTGNCLDILPTLPEKSVQCVTTSPPYWGLRDYGIEPTIWGGTADCNHEWGAQEEVNRHSKVWASSSPVGNRPEENQESVSQGAFCRCGAWRGSFGLEPTPELYIEHSVMIFREARKVLRDDGCLWLNLGDSYAASRSYQVADNMHKPVGANRNLANASPPPGLKQKDLCMIPFRVAMALQADGWYLRSVCPWIKRNCMPESCKDRPTTAIEYMFLLSKSEKYYYNHEATKLPASADTHARYGRGRSENHKYADGGPGGQTIAASFDHMRAPGVNPKAAQNAPGSKQNESFSVAVADVVDTRARRNSDWFFESFQGLLQDGGGDPLAFLVNSKGFKGSHFATFPPKLVEPCIKSSSKVGDVVLDPFGGSGTVGMVAEKLGRDYILIDLNPSYVEMQHGRIDAVKLPLFNL